MPTSVRLDEQLLNEAQRIGGHRTKRATINEALQEYIQRRKQAKILEAFGTIDFDPKYGHKKQRRKA
ncbi:MAG TPA: type II toxin-antitoxin system VapB family antitoxin [Thermoanaerobaculia bacterium]|nr:type II toxin-antitoxin system VapB family antitoxin [Thermoanaerobaculia bacterium]